MVGMVPIIYFEVVSRKDAIPTVPLHVAQTSSSSVTSGSGATAVGSSVSVASTQVVAAATGSPGSSRSVSSSSRINSAGSSNIPKPPSAHSQLYAVVLHDFTAERADELSASEGESIIIIARSNMEWVVAKPIGRLGGPGLIPITYIEIRDITTNKKIQDEELEEAMDRARVPFVEEWKRMAEEYKKSSIPLKHDAMNVRTSFAQQEMRKVPEVRPKEQQQRSPSQQPQQYSQQQQQQQQQQQPSQQLHSQQKLTNSSKRVMEDPYVLSASVENYSFSNDRYWYLVTAELSNGKHRKLCRYYQDFYDFQITLLEEFPDEAGRSNGSKQRILPFMPGPLTYVNDSISNQRRANLDEYVKSLIDLPSYISRNAVVQKLFELREGDVEEDMPEYRAKSGNASGSVAGVSSSVPPPEADVPETEPEVDVVEKVIKVKVFYEDDLIALKLGNTVPLAELKLRIIAKMELKVTDIMILFKDLNNNLIEIKNNNEYKAILGNKDKLVLIAK